MALDMNKIIKTAAIATALLATSNVFSLNVLMPVDASTQSVLQTTIALKSSYQWQVDSYTGSNLELVDNIREQAIANTLPNAAQIPGATIQRWARLGFISGITDEQSQNHWAGSLPDEVLQNISFQNVTYAVPTQIHRSNWMWVNQERMNQFAQHENLAPQNWVSFVEMAGEFKQRGMPFVLSVDDPTQNTLVFESLVLGLKGGEFYDRVFKDYDSIALKSDEMIDVFRHLEMLRPMLKENRFDDWASAIDALKKGDGAVLFGGDWIKPTMLNADGELPEQIGCNPLPQAAATFLYNLNSVVFFKQTAALDSAKLGELLFTENMQAELNLQAGSIPARLDISPLGFDRCGVRSMREFRSAAKIQTLRPSIAAGMAANEVIQKSVFEAIDDFVNSPSMTPEEGAKRLSKAMRLALYKI